MSELKSDTNKRKKVENNAHITSVAFKLALTLLLVTGCCTIYCFIKRQDIKNAWLKFCN